MHATNKQYSDKFYCDFLQFTSKISLCGCDNLQVVQYRPTQLSPIVFNRNSTDLNNIKFFRACEYWWQAIVKCALVYYIKRHTTRVCVKK